MSAYTTHMVLPGMYNPAETVAASLFGYALGDSLPVVSPLLHAAGIDSPLKRILAWPILWEGVKKLKSYYGMDDWPMIGVLPMAKYFNQSSWGGYY